MYRFLQLLYIKLCVLVRLQARLTWLEWPSDDVDDVTLIASQQALLYEQHMQRHLTSSRYPLYIVLASRPLVLV